MRPILPIAGITFTLLLAGCDRGPEEAEKEPSSYTRNGPEVRPAPAQPAPAPATPAQPGTPSADTTTPSPGTLASSEPARDTLSDTVITGKIKAAILTDPGMTGADVSVNTARGVVALAGSVKSQEQIAIASAHAQRQDGVMRVDNHLSMSAR